jgi:hypothetical protein
MESRKIDGLRNVAQMSYMRGVCGILVGIPDGLSRFERRKDNIKMDFKEMRYGVGIRLL